MQITSLNMVNNRKKQSFGFLAAPIGPYYQPYIYQPPYIYPTNVVYTPTTSYIPQYNYNNSQMSSYPIKTNNNEKNKNDNLKSPIIFGAIVLACLFLILLIKKAGNK